MQVLILSVQNLSLLMSSVDTCMRQPSRFIKVSSTEQTFFVYILCVSPYRRTIHRLTHVFTGSVGKITLQTFISSISNLTMLFYSILNQ